METRCLKPKVGQYHCTHHTWSDLEGEGQWQPQHVKDPARGGSGKFRHTTQQLTTRVGELCNAATPAVPCSCSLVPMTSHTRVITQLTECQVLTCWGSAVVHTQPYSVSLIMPNSCSFTCFLHDSLCHSFIHPHFYPTSP